MHGRVGLLVFLALAVAVPPALGRTAYPVAGGGGRALPTARGDRPLATAVRLIHPARVASMSDGGFLVGGNAALQPHSLYRVRPDGRLELVGDQVGAFAAGPDGSIYYVRFGVLTRVAVNGQRTRIAEGLSSGTVDATRAPPPDAAVTADGSLLLVAPGDRILRVRLDGSIEVAAGNGTRGFGGDGGQATAASLGFPLSPSATPDGGFLFIDSENSRIRRVAADGVITTVARMAASELAAGGHGGFVVRTGSAVRRVTRTGVVKPIRFNRRPRFNEAGVGLLGGEGSRPRNLLFEELSSLSPTPDGGLLLAVDGTVRLLAPRRIQSAALAFRAVLPTRRRVSFSVTRRARVGLAVRGEGRKRTLHTVAGPGRGRFRLPKDLPPGGYELTLSAVTDTGAHLLRRRGVIHAAKLPIRVARAVVMYDDDFRRIVTPHGIDAHVDREQNASKPGRCRRFSRIRVDCESLINSPGRDCFEILSTTLDRRGALWLGRYGDEGCPQGFSRHPAWEFGEPHSEDVPLLGETSLFG
jgi:hypothetical protein